MRGVGAARGTFGCIDERVTGRRAIKPDGGAHASRIGGVEQPLRGDRRERRVAQVHGPIACGALHRFDDDVLARHGIELVQFIAGQHIERLDQCDATGGRRRRRDEPHAAVLAHDGLALDGPVRGQVGSRPDAAQVAHTRDHLLGDLAGVERFHAVTRQRLQRARQLRLLQARAHRPRLAVLAQEHLGGIGGLEQLRLLEGQARVQARVHLEAVLGQADGRRQAHRQRQLAVPGLQQRQARRFPRDTRGQRGVGGGALDRVAVLVEVHVAGGGARRHFAGIDDHVLAIRRPVQQEQAAASQARPAGLDHGQRRAHRHGGVKGIAALTQHFQACLGGQRMRAGNGGLARRHLGGQHPARRCQQRHAQQQPGRQTGQATHERFFLRSSAATKGATNSSTGPP